MLTLNAPLFLFFFLFPYITQTAITDFDFTDRGYPAYSLAQGFYNASDVISQHPGNGDSFIRFKNLTIGLKEVPISPGISYSFQIISYNTVKDYSHIGYHDPETPYFVSFCCTETLFNQNKCDVKNEVIISKTVSRTMFNYDTVYHLDKDTPSRSFNDLQFNINETGYYITLLISCQANITLNGTIEQMNPYGWIPGGLYPLLSFFPMMLALYFILAISGIMLVRKYSDQVIWLHKYMGVIIFLGIVEFVFSMIFWQDYNMIGIKSLFPLVVRIIVTSFKKTLSNILVLVVSLGYGIIYSELPTRTTRQIIALGVCYYFLILPSELLSTLGSTDSNLDNDWFDTLAFPIALIQTIFFTAIFFSLRNIISELEKNNQHHKLEIYLKFTKLLLVVVIIAFLFALYYHWIVSWATPLERYSRWKDEWTYTAYWDLLYFAILTGSGYLWRPSQNSRTIAFFQELEPIGDDEMQELEGLDEMGSKTFSNVDLNDEILERSSASEIGFDDMRKSKNPVTSSSHQGLDVLSRNTRNTIEERNTDVSDNIANDPEITPSLFDDSSKPSLLEEDADGDADMLPVPEFSLD